MKISISKYLYIFVLLSFVFAEQPIIRIISPINNDPIITTEKTIIFGEVKKTDSLYLNNNKIKVEKGLFRFEIPKQYPGKRTFQLSARNDQQTTNKDINILTLKTLLDCYLSPFKKEIDILLTMEIISSYFGTDFFKPDNFLTKAELVQTLLKLNNIQPLGYKTRYHFKDLFPNHWAYEYIQTALNRNLVEPKESGLFGTNSYISRKELATIIKSLITITNTSQNKPFLDLNYNLTDEKLISDIAISGYLPREWTSSKEIQPNKAITRAEFAYIIARTDNLRKRIKNELGVDLALLPVRNNLEQTAKSIEIKLQTITPSTYKITALSNTDKKMIYIALKFSDKYHDKSIILADDGKGLDKIKGDNVFTTAINLSKLNKQALSYEYKMFNSFNLIEEAGKGSVAFANGTLSIY